LAVHAAPGNALVVVGVTALAPPWLPSSVSLLLHASRRLTLTSVAAAVREKEIESEGESEGMSAMEVSLDTRSYVNGL
jgi:hypothetical protein